jgi:uncharacterized membrane protein
MSLIPIHVIGGVLAILSGFVALFVLKGARLHRKSGTVFVYAMLVMSLTGVLIAIGRPGAAVNIPAGLITAYLVVTALLAVQPQSSQTRQRTRALMMAAVAFGTASLLAGFVSVSRSNPALAVPQFLFGVVALSAGMGDWRTLRSSTLQGSRRLKRHLWRMCFALFIAAASFFLGPVRRIPEPLRVPLFRVLPFVVLVVMAYWLWRLRARRSARSLVGAAASEVI